MRVAPAARSCRDCVCRGLSAVVVDGRRPPRRAPHRTAARRQRQCAGGYGRPQQIHADRAARRCARGGHLQPGGRRSRRAHRAARSSPRPADRTSDGKLHLPGRQADADPRHRRRARSRPRRRHYPPPDARRRCAPRSDERQYRGHRQRRQSARRDADRRYCRAVRRQARAGAQHAQCRGQGAGAAARQRGGDEPQHHPASRHRRAGGAGERQCRGGQDRGNRLSGDRRHDRGRRAGHGRRNPARTGVGHSVRRGLEQRQGAHRRQ